MIKAIINPFPLVLPLVLGMVLLCSACSLNANLSCGELQGFWEETQDFSERVQALPAESLLFFPLLPEGRVVRLRCPDILTRWKSQVPCVLSFDRAGTARHRCA